MFLERFWSSSSAFLVLWRWVCCDILLEPVCSMNSLTYWTRVTLLMLFVICLRVVAFVTGVLSFNTGYLDPYLHLHISISRVINLFAYGYLIV